MSIASRTLHYRLEAKKAWEERQRIHKRTVGFAKRLGVTAAGLELLARLVATPDKARKHGTEHLPLIAKFLIRTYGPPEWKLEITDAGREIVRQAREMGW